MKVNTVDGCPVPNATSMTLFSSDFLTFFIVCTCMHTRMRDIAYIWKSQDSFAESVLPPYTVVVGTELSSSRLGASALHH